MARPKPKRQEVLPVILDAAVSLLQERSFDQLTMKALAAEAGMSVGKLYHFFPSKDDLFLQLEIVYFQGCFDRIQTAISASAIASGESDDYAQQVFQVMLRAYFNYAVEHFELYKLVTSPPKVYGHYMGTHIEPLAREELDAALKAIAIFRRFFKDALVEQNGSVSPGEVEDKFLLLVNSVHGLVLMSRSTVWPYISMGEGELPKQKVEVGKAYTAPQLEIEDQLALLVQTLIC